MFDNLVESDALNAGSRGRSRYFMVSTFVVGILFLSAVVYSLYAAEIGIGDAEFEMSRLIAPEVIEAPEPKVEKRNDAPLKTTERRSGPPTRVINMARPDEPQFVPNQVSTVANRFASRPDEPFRIGTADSGPATPSGPRVDNGTGSDYGTPNDTAANGGEKASAEPPPVKRPVRKDIVVSLGVVTGKAKSLPVPVYPQSARALGVHGTVNVQILIDEEGNVISVRAVDGTVILRKAAEQAAWKAKFAPTLLSGQPVKATGLIAYNFKKS